MAEFANRAGLQVATELADFIENEALPDLGIDASVFWQGAADIFARFTPENRALLAKRDEIQAAIDVWHKERRGGDIVWTDYRAFLESIGYLVPDPAPFKVGATNVDDEVARMAGPQLVVPV